MADAVLTEGSLLGGAIRYTQPASGYRTGIEPVFLAASLPARAGQRVLEAGTGAGAGLLCLAHRVPGILGVGVEIEPAMASVAGANFSADGRGSLAILAGDITSLPLAVGAFDHAMANPPWHEARGTPPGNALRRRAKQAPEGLLARWVAAMGGAIRSRGTLTLILPPRAVPEALTALAAAGCDSARLFPLWPRPGREPRIVLLQAVKGGAAAFRLLPGLIVHDGAGYTPKAEAVLRDAAALTFDQGNVGK